MKNIIFLCIFISAVIAISRANEDGNINVALETVLEFDGKEMDADKLFINKMQGFLEKIRRAITRTRKSRLIDKENIKINDFLENLVNTMGGLDKREMGIITKTIEKEVERRNTQDDSFRQLFENPSVRRSFDNRVQTLRKMHPSSETSTEVSGISEKMPNLRTTVQNWTNKLMLWIKNIFQKDKDESMPKGFNKVIDDLQEYSKRKTLGRRGIYKTHQLESRQQKEKEIDEALHDPEKLVNIVKNALRSLLFDQYSNLDTLKRDQLQMKLQTFWMDPDNYTPGKHDDESEHDKRNKNSISWYTTTHPPSKEKLGERKRSTAYSKLVSNENKEEFNDELSNQPRNNQVEKEDTQSSDMDKGSDKYSGEKVRSTDSSESKSSKSREQVERTGQSPERGDDFERLFEHSIRTAQTIRTSPASPRREKPPKHGRNIKKLKEKFSTESENQNLEDMSEIKELQQMREKSISNDSKEKTHSKSIEHSKSKDVAQSLRTYKQKPKKEINENESKSKKTSENRSEDKIKNKENNSDLENKSIERHFKESGNAKKALKRMKKFQEILFSSLTGETNATVEKSPQQQVIEENIAKIRVDTEDNFTGHSEEKKRINVAKKHSKKISLSNEFENNKLDEKNKEDEDKILQNNPNKTYNRARSNEWLLFSDKFNETLSKNLINEPKSTENFNLNADNKRPIISDTGGVVRMTPITLNSQLAPNNLDMTEVSIIDQDEPAYKNDTDYPQLGFTIRMKSTTTIGDGKEANESAVNITEQESTPITFLRDLRSFNETANDDKQVLSAETAALYKALEEQERKYGLDNLLENTDLVDLKNLNISFINQNHIEGSTVAAVGVQGSNQNMSFYVL